MKASFLAAADRSRERGRASGDGALQKRPPIAYIRPVGLPTMAINAARNKRSGPGGSTRRLHHSPPGASPRGGPIWGRNRLVARGKGVGFPPACYRRYRAKHTVANDNRM